MQLKKVELIGFKSFADRTNFTFDGGITAVVGPNGCGKSNMVDAVKWVLGEQSAKSLRAAQMGDCIFAGTSSRKPLGFAEVTLTFDNKDGRIALDYDEVDLTRRIYGSGEGQYFINRRPCRLRDIKELLMGTGVGTSAYSIIEQGQVGRVIASDPKELRAIFDEAAGISLYKSRLRMAANKLERVTANLLRAGDIIAEVEKRLRSVKYQAAKARRFREASERLKELKRQRARLAFQALGLRRDELDGALGETANPEWKTLAYNEISGEVVAPHGTVGFRWGDPGKWNLEEKDGKGRDTKLQLSLAGIRDELADVAFPYFGNREHDHFTGTDHPDVLMRRVPAKRLRLKDGEALVASVYDLFMANYGVDQGFGGEHLAKSYDDLEPYTPAWAEKITGVPRDHIVTVAREFAGNAEKTNGRSMVILGAGVNNNPRS